MSKYNLTDLLPEGTDAEYKASKEADRLKKHPEGDKIKSVQAMMAKEKSMREDKYDDMTAGDSDLPTDELKTYVSKMYRAIEKGASTQQVDKMIAGLTSLQKKAGISEDNDSSNIKENYQMDGETYDRIDGLVDQPLLTTFKRAFELIYDDFIEQGEEFEVDDVVDFLTICLDKHSKENNMEDQLPDGFNEGTSGPKHADGTPKSNDEMTDDEREDYYNNLDSVDEVAGDLDESKTLEDLAKRLGISVKDLEARVNKFQSAERGAMDTRAKLSVAEGGAYDADEDTQGMINKMRKDGKSSEDFVDEGLKEHFQRFLKDYQ